MKVIELQNGAKRVDITVKIDEKGETRDVNSRFKDESYKVASATVSDDSGTIKLTLWNEQIDQVKVGDTIKIENGYITTFRGEDQLNVGKYGKLTVL